MTAEYAQAADRWVEEIRAACGIPPALVGRVDTCRNCGHTIQPARTSTGWTHEGDWQGTRCQGALTGAVPQAEAGRRSPEETLAAVDAAVEGRCAGPGCSQVLTEHSASAYWCSATCQEVWQQRQAGRPSPGSAPVRGSETVDASMMRWRPDLVTAFDDTGMELIEEMPAGRDGITRRWYRHTDGRRFLRVDDGHRWVGAFAELADGPQPELWGRLERELGDRRQLDPEPGRSEPTAIMRVGDRVYDERDRPALIAWLHANGLNPEDVPAGQTVSVDGDTLILDCFTRDAEGNLRMDESGEAFLAQPVAVPLREPPPEPRSDLLRRMGEAFDQEVLGREGERAVLSGRPDPCVRGTVFWLPDRPADPEAPTHAELAGGIDLTPYLAPAPRVTVDATRATEAFRRAGEAMAQLTPGLLAVGEGLAQAVQAESDRVALRAVCGDESMYERALAAAQDRGWSARRMMAAVTAGQYTEAGRTAGGIDGR